MTRICRSCLEALGDEEHYHLRCLRKLFRTSKVPTLDITIARLHLDALEMIGHTSLSGVQKKISVDLGPARATLRVAAEGGHYILKPQVDTYPSLPENEHVTTRLASLVDIATSPNGLVSLADGSLAYIVRRFDRLDDGTKVRQEDFCQLAGQSPKEKYDSSAERCAKLIRRYATEPLVEMLKFYRLLVFVWWSGNGDAHLKNFSLFTDADGIVRFTPAYDLLCTRLVIPNDHLALPIIGRKDNVRRRTWLDFATYCGLPETVARRVLQQQADVLDEALRMIDHCFLPDDQKATYRELITRRSDQLV